MSSRKVQCRFCTQDLEKEYLEQHLKLNHLTHPDFQITCGVNNCQKVYKNLSSLRSHRSRQHYNQRRAETNDEEDDIDSNSESVTNDEEENIDNNSESITHEENAADHLDIDDLDYDDNGEDTDYDSDDYDEILDSDDDSDEEDGQDHANNEEETENLQKITLGLMFLSMRAQTQVTNDIVLNVIKSLDAVVKRYVELIDINREVAKIDTVHGLNTIYKQDAYFAEQFDVVQPTIQHLSSEFQIAGHGPSGNPNVKLKDDEFIYIPIRDVLSKRLSNDKFRELLEQNSEDKEGIFRSFKDGSRYKQHPMFSSNPKAVQIKLYYDEVEFCDGLGSRAGGKQKLGFVYSQYGNLPPMHQATWSYIDLVAVIKYSHVKEFGLSPLSEIIVKDIKEIENGIRLPNGDIIYGTVSALTGDNLGIHMMCGFKESFTAKHPCRFCMASLQEMQIMIEEDTQRLRNPETHRQQLAKMEAAATEEEKQKLSQEYGINRSCPLSKIIAFDPTTSTTPDIPHDFMGGIILLQIKLFLNRFCIKGNWINLDEFNGRVASFDYGYSEKSCKPSPIKPQHLKPKNKIKQTMTQAWMLAIILPFIVYDRINDENAEYLENHLQLLEIMSIVCSHTISLGSLSLLESLIPAYLETFARIYKNDDSTSGRKFIPKQHFLLHYPRLIAMFGPLVHFWTLRFEGKHQYFKKIVQAMRNWKNLPLTLAKKHQLWQALQWTLFQEDQISIGLKKMVTTSKFPFSHLFPEEDDLLIVSWVEIHHVKYTANKCFIPVGYENGLPLFAELFKIVLKNESPIFVCKKVQTVQHDSQLMAYEIKKSDEFILHTPDSLVAHNVLHCHKLQEKNYIILKQLWFDLY
ncbi:uncharacterized protein LOC127291456 [Leptopilina boulardi]|uniref:uncharacterized protein LOC127291456 n=1 Tax=Leptopilina boulardi TaxID=63433 RepID=UPI0021F59FB8|nr:uncharacterized protein LOC127291456 [Leptopilina boulardi]